MTGLVDTSRPDVASRSLSVRLRLTLWNAGVVILILLGMGIVLPCTLRVTLLTGVDHDLERGLSRLQRMIDQNGALLFSPGHTSPAVNGEAGPLIFDPQCNIIAGYASRSTVAYDASAVHGAASTGRPVFSTIRWRAQDLRILSFPIRERGKIAYIVQEPRSLLETQQEVGHVSRILLLLAAPAALFAGMGGAFLTERALRPVQQITHAAARIEAEDLSGRLAVSGCDELSELAGTFNGMLERLDDAFEQRKIAYARMEKAYDQQRRFTADASHELKSPLTVIEGTITLALSDENRTAAQYRKSLATVARSAGMMTRIVQDLLLLARSDAEQLALDRRPVLLNQILVLASEAVVHGGEQAGRVRSPGADSETRVNADPNDLVRLFVNLLDNALRHTPPEESVTISSVVRHGEAIVTVSDTGCGIAPEHLAHIFERFYRIDSARTRAQGGTGLGLSIAQSIAEAHGGTLAIESEVGVGTRAIVRLPVL